MSGPEVLPITNVVALGDNDFEMNAARMMVAECGDARAILKTVRFQARPTLAEHVKQVQRVAESFEKIVKSSSELAVVLQKSPKQATDRGRSFTSPLP